MLRQTENRVPSHVAMVSSFYQTLLVRTQSYACSHHDKCHVATSSIYCHSLSRVVETHLQAITVPGYGLRRGLAGCAGPHYIT